MTFTSRFISVPILVAPDSQVDIGIKVTEQEVAIMKFNPLCIESYHESFKDDSDEVPVYTRLNMKSRDSFVIPMLLRNFEDILNTYQ